MTSFSWNPLSVLRRHRNNQNNQRNNNNNNNEKKASSSNSFFSSFTSNNNPNYPPPPPSSSSSSHNPQNQHQLPQAATNHHRNSSPNKTNKSNSTLNSARSERIGRWVRSKVRVISSCTRVHPDHHLSSTTSNNGKDKMNIKPKLIVISPVQDEPSGEKSIASTDDVLESKRRSWYWNVEDEPDVNGWTLMLTAKPNEIFPQHIPSPWNSTRNLTQTKENFLDEDYGENLTELLHEIRLSKPMPLEVNKNNSPPSHANDDLNKLTTTTTTTISPDSYNEISKEKDDANAAAVEEGEEGEEDEDSQVIVDEFDCWMPYDSGFDSLERPNHESEEETMSSEQQASQSSKPPSMVFCVPPSLQSITSTSATSADPPASLFSSSASSSSSTSSPSSLSSFFTQRVAITGCFLLATAMAPFYDNIFRSVFTQLSSFLANQVDLVQPAAKLATRGTVAMYRSGITSIPGSFLSPLLFQRHFGLPSWLPNMFVEPGVSCLYAHRRRTVFKGHFSSLFPQTRSQPQAQQQQQQKQQRRRETAC